MLHKLLAMDRNLIFSGQLFFRYSKQVIEMDTSRELFSVCGIIAVPNNVMKGEHQYTIAGYDSKTNGIILSIDTNGLDIKNQSIGRSTGSLLKDPIWRI